MNRSKANDAGPNRPRDAEQRDDDRDEKGNDERDDSATERVVENLLPPGIDFDEAKDPGSKHPSRPTDNRS